MKYFKTAGPCMPDIHYLLPAANRLPGLQRRLDQQLYFVIHAPRQAGKTTLLLQLAQALTRAGRYTALLVSLNRNTQACNNPNHREHGESIWPASSP